MFPRTGLPFAFLLWVLACTPGRKKVDDDIVRRIRFEGNGGPLSGHNDLQLRQQMAQQATRFGLLIFPLMYLSDPKTLQRELLPREAYRLEVFYAHNGFFDARVLGWEVRRVRRASEKQGTGRYGFVDRQAVFDVKGFVDPGPQSRVRKYEIEGLDTPGQRKLDGTTRRLGGLREDHPYNLASVQEAKTLLQEGLWDLGRAYASVETEMLAVPKRRVVDVKLKAEPGILARFGEVTVTGLENVPQRYIERSLYLEPGSTYKLTELREAQQQLFNTNLFSLATVVPDLSDPTDPDVPIDVRLTETKFRTIRLGVGFEAENLVQFQPRVSARYRDVNLFHSLLRLEADSSLGVALATIEEERLVEPIYSLGLGLTYPRLGRELDLELRTRLTQDMLPGLWLYRQPSADLQAVVKPTQKIVIRAGPHVEEYRYVNLEEGDRQPATRLFGAAGEFRNPYQITSLDANLAVDWTSKNRYRTTTGGTFGAANVRWALPVTPDGYSYLSYGGEWKRWVKVKFSRRARSFPLRLAWRLRGRQLVPIRESALPYPELAFMGGSNSLRGFRYSQVGPYDTICTYEQSSGETTVSHFHLPQGGVFAGEGTFELHYPWLYNLTLATFFDVGLLTDDLLAFRDHPRDIRWSAGVGSRYDTQVGPIRFDLSFRRLYPEDLAPESFVGCRTDDELPRNTDFFSQWFGTFRPPVAMVFFLTLGESP